MTKKYTAEEEATLRERYTEAPTREVVAELAVELNRSERSITSKLARMGIYQKIEYVTKTGDKPVAKSELVEVIQSQLGLSKQQVFGLDKAHKPALNNIIKAIYTLKSEGQAND